VKEHKKSKDHGFCCGAGGGLFWVEEHEPRINHRRVDQLSELNPSVIATSCPYCAKMLDDGIKDKDLGNSVVVKDLVELLEESPKNT
jgi:Fe-S oxidoreductase